MDAERWRNLQDLFAAARAVQGDDRERLLQQHARLDADLAEQARLLLRADAQPGVMDALASRLVSVAEVLDAAAPVRVGSYKIAGELGRGGMGVVYHGERADGEFQQRVAIKLIGTSDPEDPLHQRFLAERQILAALVHPNIARLLDGGVTDEGRPYLVMEYVDGLPLTTYCDEHRLDVGERLRLFTDVCTAVQHAHQNLVIHRDLKPTNILVSTDGRVHLLDFGIAKLINPALAAVPTPLTRVDARMMTPEYASPEQVRGESLTTASDIYALGVLLYELLCGSRPYRFTSGSPVDVITLVCDRDPEPPSMRATRVDGGDGHTTPEAVAQLRNTSADRLARLLDGDLDSIVLMAMRKEPGRRYQSADMLRQDVERYLAGLPVVAHQGSRRYRAGKFLRRHRVEAAATAIVVVALVAGLTAAVVQGRRAGRERDRAAQALAESSGVSDFLLELFERGDPDEVSPSQLSALDLVKRGAERADDLSNQPIVHARLLDVVGQMSLNLGQFDEARRRLEQAVAIRRSTPGSAPLDLANSLIHLSWVYRDRSDFEPARRLVDEALEIRRAALPVDDPDIGIALAERGRLAYTTEQERYYRQALAILARAPAMAERRVNVLQQLSTNLRRQGRLAEAVATNREALALAERAFGPEHHATGYAMIHLGDFVRDIEDPAGAEQLYRRGLDLMIRHYGGNSVRLIHGLNSLTDLLAERGSNEAELHCRRALAISRSATGPEHPRVADQLRRLAGELARQNRLQEAETVAREALDLSIQTLGPRHQMVTASSMPLLARILDRQQRYQEADDTFRQAFELAAKPSNVIIGQMYRDYGLVLLRRGDHARAERQLLESLSLLEQAYGAGDHPNILETKRSLMELYRQLRRPDAVERYRVPPGRFIPR